MLSNLSDIIKFLEVQWYRKSGLAATSIAAIPALIALAISAKISLLATVILCTSIELLLVIVWLYSRRIPKTPKGKIGFIISLSCSDDS